MWLLAFFLASFIILVIWVAFEANAWISRCADNTDPAYIQEEAARRAACE
jgi:hypothetical protein